MHLAPLVPVHKPLTCLGQDCRCHRRRRTQVPLRAVQADRCQVCYRARRLFTKLRLHRTMQLVSLDAKTQRLTNVPNYEIRYNDSVMHQFTIDTSIPDFKKKSGAKKEKKSEVT